MIKLIALDMDGTLLNDEKKITPRTYQAIQQAKQAGVKVVLASGRPLEGLRPYLEQLELTSEQDFVISYNGSLVQRVGSGEIIHKTTLNGSDGTQLAKVAEQLGVFIHAFSAEHGLITQQHNPWTDIESSINGMDVSEVNFASLQANDALTKIMFVAEESILDKAIANLPAELRKQYTVVRSAPFFLEFLHRDSNKGVGVEQLANILGLNASEVMCAGDADNDRHMLQYAGLAVAMANADPEIKAMANYIAPSNKEDGVAVAIEENVLSTLCPTS
ncbi:sugar-phosphatase [Agarivorans aestuarii]|uniref:sugar-phosphatase n=1 Tax=Agarivorans aestuarii TaxID=1563703 RepID=UPI001C7F31B2|nr:sugar-phosphatase [Agarivorans aestuarii]